MSTATAPHDRKDHDRQRPREQARTEKVRKLQAEQRHRAHRRRLLWTVAIIAVVGGLTAMMITALPSSKTTSNAAPNFTLTTTAGQTVGLSQFRGKPVLLYFSEGAGCDACQDQMVNIEKNQAAFDKAGVTVLPIVMNPADEIQPDLARFGIQTPYLIDSDGSVSKAYDVLGKGMHAGLPGHGFVLIDAQGTQRWQGEYPSMFLASADLLKEVNGHLQ
jgi:peroxiredoxin